MKARTAVERGEESLVSDPGLVTPGQSYVYGGRRRKKKCEKKQERSEKKEGRDSPTYLQEAKTMKSKTKHCKNEQRKANEMSAYRVSMTAKNKDKVIR